MLEQLLFQPSMDKPFRIALYALMPFSEASAHLGFQWIWQLANRHPEVSCDLAFSENPRGYLSRFPLRGMHAWLFSMPYEIQIKQLRRILKKEGLAESPWKRTEKDPVIVLGGHAVRLIPKTLLTVADCLVLADGEVVMEEFLQILTLGSRKRILQALKEKPWAWVWDGQARADYWRLPPEGFCKQANIPRSAFLSPASVFPDAFLIEVNRGCRQKCRFCFIAFAQETFHTFETQGILHILLNTPHKGRIGLVGAAVGDHPGLPMLLEEGIKQGWQISLSSLKLNVLRPSILELLARTGDKTLTLAPEAGNFPLRKRCFKPYKDEYLWEGMERAAKLGIKRIKLYFLIGLPEETREDVDDIATFLKGVLDRTSPYGTRIIASIGLFVPKPLTPWEDQPFLSLKEARIRYQLIRKALPFHPNITLRFQSLQEAKEQHELLSREYHLQEEKVG